jgi:hypothetical protein
MRSILLTLAHGNRTMQLSSDIYFIAFQVVFLHAYIARSNTKAYHAFNVARICKALDIILL